ncbi:MAG: FCD domain-containing protein [Christensenellales bacterium]
MREALIQLCSENVLRSIPRQGYQVIEINRKDIQDLTQLRLLLELGNLPYALANMTRERLDELKRQNEERRQPSATKQLWESRNRNTRFHMTLIRYGENAQIANCMEHASGDLYARVCAAVHSKKACYQPLPDDNMHDLIVTALENHDIYTAHECLKQDILLMAETLYADL